MRKGQKAARFNLLLITAASQILLKRQNLAYFRQSAGTNPAKQLQVRFSHSKITLLFELGTHMGGIIEKISRPGPGQGTRGQENTHGATPALDSRATIQLSKPSISCFKIPS